MNLNNMMFYFRFGDDLFTNYTKYENGIGRVDIYYEALSEL